MPTVVGKVLTAAAAPDASTEAGTETCGGVNSGNDGVDGGFGNDEGSNCSGGNCGGANGRNQCD